MNKEKDRYGEFIRLLERAREDVYFAAQDRALIQKLKRRWGRRSSCVRARFQAGTSPGNL